MNFYMLTPTCLAVVIGTRPEMSGYTRVDRVRWIQLHTIAGDPHQKRTVL